MSNDDPEKPVKKKLRIKWLEPNTDRKKRSDNNERRLAKRLGGKRTPRSGGKLWSRYDKSEVHLASKVVTEGKDLETKDFCFENKRSEKKSISVKKDWVDGIREAARREGKYPGVILTFEVPRKDPEDWVLIPIDVFDRLRRNQE